MLSKSYKQPHVAERYSEEQPWIYGPVSASKECCIGLVNSNYRWAEASHWRVLLFVRS